MDINFELGNLIDDLTIDIIDIRDIDCLNDLDKMDKKIKRTLKKLIQLKESEIILNNYNNEKNDVYMLED